MGRVFFNTRKNIVALDTTYQVLDSDSGTVFMLSSTGGAYTITLPASPEDGFYCKFVVKENTPTGDITITAGSAILDFVMTDMAGNISNSTAGTAKTTIVCHTECTKGDYVNIFSDGSTYYGEAVSAIDDAIDHTAQ